MRIRIKFTKNDSVRYLGHLDIMRTFQRCFHRAGIQMTYSEGFNPHQKMNFAQPLGVGILSRGEYLDAVIADGQDPAQIRESLDAVTGDGFDIIEVRQLKEDASKAMAAVRFADYTIRFHDSRVPDTKAYLARPVIILQKKTQTGMRDVDVKQALLSVKETDQCLHMRMRAEGEHSIKPELVLQDILSFQGLPFDRDRITIIREELYAQDMTALIDHQTERYGE